MSIAQLVQTLVSLDVDPGSSPSCDRNFFFPCLYLFNFFVKSKWYYLLWWLKKIFHIILNGWCHPVLGCLMMITLKDWQINQHVRQLLMKLHNSVFPNIACIIHIHISFHIHSIVIPTESPIPIPSKSSWSKTNFFQWLGHYMFFIFLFSPVQSICPNHIYVIFINCFNSKYILTTKSNIPFKGVDDCCPMVRSQFLFLDIC